VDFLLQANSESSLIKMGERTKLAPVVISCKYNNENIKRQVYLNRLATFAYKMLFRISFASVSDYV
jgi:hypothetical protein